MSTSLSQGDPSAFLPIVSFTLTSFSPPFAEQLMAAGLELTGKSDLRFTDTLYKVTDRIKLVLQAEKRKDYQPLVLNTTVSVFLTFAGTTGPFPL